jgi:hypothetical protein
MTWMKTMHQRNVKSIHGVKRSRIRWKYLEMGKTGWGNEDTGSWGVDFTQQDSMEEPANGGLGVTLTVVLVREREVRKTVKG